MHLRSGHRLVRERAGELRMQFQGAQLVRHFDSGFPAGLQHLLHPFLNEWGARLQLTGVWPDSGKLPESFGLS
ncbi:MAG: hypothetical protein JWM59_4544 [Verrucomicrobiales bacterium]|nr:hypothetical protein [Verrucomicrobiales bacterium]